MRRLLNLINFVNLPKSYVGNSITERSWEKMGYVTLTELIRRAILRLNFKVRTTNMYIIIYFNIYSLLCYIHKAITKTLYQCNLK